VERFDPDTVFLVVLRVIRTTELAILFQLGSRKSIWVPKACVLRGSRCFGCGTEHLGDHWVMFCHGEICVPGWLAEEKLGRVSFKT